MAGGGGPGPESIQGEPGSPEDRAFLRYMMNRNRPMTERVYDI